MSGDGDEQQSGSASTRAQAWLAALEREPRDAHEAVALLVHAVLLGHGFRDANVAEGSESALSDGWGVGGYGGQYRHGRSAMAFEVRSTPLGARLRVTGVDNANDEAVTLDLPVADHYEEGEGEGEGEDGGSWQSRLRNVDTVATLVLVNVAHRLVPDAAKEGYESGASNARAGSSSSGGAQPTARPQPGPRPLPPAMRDPDDPLRVGPIRGGGVPYPRAGQPAFPGAPLGGTPAFGRDDLMPQLPGAPHWGPRGGGLGGNLMGPRNFPGPGGVGGVGGMPRPGFPRVPPGARYDPMGPGGLEPDNDELLPPGQRNPRTGPDGGPPDHFFM